METPDHSLAGRGAADRPQPASDEQDRITADRSSYVDAVLFRRRSSTRAERARTTRKVRAAHEPERI
jgi:hypothetical protein